MGVIKNGAGIIILSLCVYSCVWAADEKLGQNDFVTTAFADALDKLNKVSSGEESLIIKDWRDKDKSDGQVDTDILGRPITPKPLSPIKGMSAKK